MSPAGEGRPDGRYDLPGKSSLGRLPDPTADLGFPECRPVTEAILAYAASSADKIAVEHGGMSWSYRDLARTSHSIACGLRSAGIRVGESVAVTGPRSFGFVAAMLGVWRSGAVLVNVDPSLPDERRHMMLAQAEARCLVRVGPGAIASPEIERTLSVSMSGEIVDGVAGSTESPLPCLSPEQAAYIFFTSGSTGTPKAVKGRHAGLSHFLQWQRREFAIGAHDRGSQLTALSFDVILRDTFLVLSAGGTLCIPGELAALDPSQIVSWLQNERISVLHVVPSLARMWLHSVSAPTSLPHLEHVFFAGEPLTDVLVKRWRETFPSQAEVVNLYGPTETTLAKCFYRVPAEPEEGVQSVGLPLPNTQILILNPQRSLCGPNEPGEIAIRTPFRTLGYLNNAEANSKVFVPNPFGSSPDDVIYLTGDGGSYRPDGLLAIHGRLDTQVKIRGIRIEPGEIEAAICHSELVREVAVVAQPQRDGEKALIAYLVSRNPLDHGQRRAFVRRLRSYLRQRLPEAMVPAGFVVLDALPLNPNGKINRRALPAPERSAFVDPESCGPTTKLESDLVALWIDLLGLADLGIDDDFFDLGGHSLLAVQLAQRIKDQLGRICTLSMLFRNRTVRKLAHEIELDSPKMSEATVLDLQPAGEGPGLFCLAGLHLYQELADRLAPDVPVFGVFVPYEEQILDADPTTIANSRSIEELAAAYIEAIRGRQAHGPYFICGVSFGGVVAYETARQLQQAGEVVALVALLDSVLPGVVRRDWFRWTVNQVRRVRDEGIVQFGARVKRRILRQMWREVTMKPGRDAELDALQARRQRFYHEAEVAYRVPRSEVPALLVRAQDKRFHNDDIRDPTYGWGRAATSLKIVDVPGDHIGILARPNVDVLAKVLRPYVARAQKELMAAAPR
jgi:amino acid adenylation domain-containing protein